MNLKSGFYNLNIKIKFEFNWPYYSFPNRGGMDGKQSSQLCCIRAHVP